MLNLSPAAVCCRNSRAASASNVLRRTNVLLWSTALLWAASGCGETCEAASGHLLYVLQPETLSKAELTDAAFTWLVLEPTTTGQADGDYAPAEIEQIRSDGPCGKTALAYLSIGEAEDYRDYWNSDWVDGSGTPIPGVAPDWLGPTNPDFPGNYKVRYWDPEWQSLMFGTTSGPGITPLDRIIDQGFDGVYLDIIDAYEFWSGPDGGSELSRMEARSLMIDFVEAIAVHARDVRGVGGFLVFPQNAAEIIRNDSDEFDTETDRYFAAISGIGQEDLYYDELQAQPGAETQYVLDQLREFLDRGKTVLVTDYVIDTGDPSAGTNDDRVADFFAACRNESFIPYAATDDRELNSIVTFGGSGWSQDQPAPDACSKSLPSMSPWGLIVLVLTLLSAGSMVQVSRSPANN